MTLDNPGTTERFINAFKGWPLAVQIGVPLVLALVIVGAVLFGFDWFSDWNFRRQMSKANANVVKELNQLSNIQDQQAATEKELQDLHVAEAAQKERVMQAAKDAEAAANAERDAQIAAKQALANVNAVNAQDFTNTSLENAEKARCRAFPDAEGCK